MVGQPLGAGGARPQPPAMQLAPRKNQAMVLAVVALALLAIGLVGFFVMRMVSQPAPPTPTVRPTVVPPVTPAPITPTPAPSTVEPSQTPEPTATPSESPPPGSSVEVGQGVRLTLAPDWQLLSRDDAKGYVELTNGQAVIAAQVINVTGSPTGQQIADAYLKQLESRLTGAKRSPAQTLDVKNDRLSAGIGNLSGTRTGSQGSVKLNYLAVASVRSADGLTVLCTLINSATVDNKQFMDAYVLTVNSLLNSQLAA